MSTSLALLKFPVSLTGNDFFDDDLGSFKFRDLLKERDEILLLLKGNGPIAKRVRAFTHYAPEVIRRYYLHKDSITVVRVLVIAWTLIATVVKVFVTGMTVEESSSDQATEEQESSQEENDNNSTTKSTDVTDSTATFKVDLGSNRQDENQVENEQEKQQDQQNEKEV